MLVIVVVAASVLGLGVWAGARRVRASSMASPVTVARTLPDAAPRLPAAPSAPAHALEVGHIDTALLEAAKDAAASRLWRLAFAAPSQAENPPLVNTRLRANIVAILDVDTLDPNYFPRRPALMPQLLQAVNDPGAASDRLSRIVAHDPVLAADVLRLANSGLYRTSTAPIETIQRAIVVCGVDALRGMLAAAMLRPVFRATRKNFPRFPRVLWERTERAARAAELYAQQTRPQDRFEAQLVVLLSALGPLVVYGATLDVYARNAHFAPSSALCMELIAELAPRISLRIARDWQTSARLLAALGKLPEEPLTTARDVGELLGTLSFLESQTVISAGERNEFLTNSALPPSLASSIWAGL